MAAGMATLGTIGALLIDVASTAGYPQSGIRRWPLVLRRRGRSTFMLSGLALIVIGTLHTGFNWAGTVHAHTGYH
jgi:hypothetical protein